MVIDQNVVNSMINESNESIYLERILCDEAGGWQDQIAAAYGGLNKPEDSPLPNIILMNTVF